MTTQQPLLASILRHLDACDDLDPPHNAVGWAGKRRVSRAAYYACDRGDWLLWLAAKIRVERKLVVLAACDCAELALRHVPDGEERPRKAIETTRAWCRGKATLEQVRGAAKAARVAGAAWGATWAAMAAARAAEEAARAAMAAARAAEEAAEEVAIWTAEAAELKRCAQLVRKRIPWKIMQDALLAVEISP